MTALVVALTGTDHHPFERMVQWVDAAAVRRPDVHFLIQHGASRPPLVAEGHEFLAYDHLVALLHEASVVVCHGGPGTITDARAAGHVPVCVPRDPQLGEHVDSHQQRFAALVGGAGVVHAASSLQRFHHELDRVLLDSPEIDRPEIDRPGGGRHSGAATLAARLQLAGELDDLVGLRPRRLAWLHRFSPVG